MNAFADLRLPLLQAPMFLVSSARLASACASAGIVGADLVCMGTRFVATRESAAHRAVAVT